MKGISPFVAYTLIILLSVSAIATVLLVGIPTLNRARDTLTINSAQNSMQQLDSLIREVASEGSNSLRTMLLTVSGGKYFVTNGKLIFSFDTQSPLIPNGTNTTQGNVRIEAGQTALSYTSITNVNPLFLNQTNVSVYLHGGNGSTGYNTFDINLTNGNLTNTTVTGYSLSGSNVNYNVMLDSDNYTSVTNTLNISGLNSIAVYYNASDGTWRNVTELANIGQGSGWSLSGTNLNYTLAGGDGYDYGIRDALAGGSYWTDANGNVYGKINISNDFITASSSTTDFKIYNSTNGLLFNSTWNSILLDNTGLNSTYNLGSTQNTTVYFYDWTNQTWKTWMNGTGNSTHGMPNWLDPRNKQEFKWRYAFAKNNTPSINYTYLMTAQDPFVRVFVDSNATGMINTTPLFIGPTTIGTSTSPDATRYTSQRKVWKANGYCWEFYSNGTNEGWRSSSDCVSWGAFNSLRTSSEGGFFSTWIDSSNNIYYAWTQATSGFSYRQGTANADGTITWAFAEVSVSTTSANNCYYPTIYASSTSNVWVSVSCQPTASNYMVDTMNCVLNCGTATNWSEKQQFNTGQTATPWGGIITPLSTTSKYSLTMGPAASAAQGALKLETTSDAGTTWSTPISTTGIHMLDQTSAVAIGDTTHVCTTTTATANPVYFNFGLSPASAPTETTEDSSGSASSNNCGISTDGSSTLVIAYMTGTTVYYQTSTNSGSSFGSKAALTSSETSAVDLSSSYSITANTFYLTWTSGSASPFNVRFASVNMNQHALTIPLSLGETKNSLSFNANKPGNYFITSGGATENVLFATQNFKNNTHAFNLTASSTLFNYTYVFNSTINNNFLFSLGTMGVINTANFDPTINQTKFSSEIVESVANSTLTFYNITNDTKMSFSPLVQHNFTLNFTYNSTYVDDFNTGWYNYTGVEDATQITNASFVTSASRTINSHYHNVTNMLANTSISFNLTEHEGVTQQNYDQRMLLINGTQQASISIVPGSAIGLLKSINMTLAYSLINITGPLSIQTGNYKLCVQNNGVSNGLTQVSVQAC